MRGLLSGWSQPQTISRNQPYTADLCVYVHISGTYTAYKCKYHKLPVLRDDVTDDEGDSDEGSDDSKEEDSD